MQRSFTRWIAYALMASVSGCSLPHHGVDGRHRSELIDIAFKRRHLDPNSHAKHDPVMGLARDLTMIEDDLRRDGTITVKKPDVWGDGNLMVFLQEFDGLIAERTKSFSETLQGYIARSDQAEFQSLTALGASLGGGSSSSAPAAAPSVAVSNSTSASSAAPASAAPAKLPDPIDIAAVPLFDLIKNSRAAAPAAVQNLSIEPTELARQHATYIDVCQALRRRHMGDDNSRAAGYGLYKFRVPVSVLPGRETSRGHSAVVTLRAQLQVDEANLKYMFPKLMIADLVDSLTPIIAKDWGKKDVASSATAAKRTAEELNKLREAGVRGETDAEKKQAEEFAVQQIHDLAHRLLSELEVVSEDFRIAGYAVDPNQENIDQARNILRINDFKILTAIGASSVSTSIQVLPQQANDIYMAAPIKALREAAQVNAGIELGSDGKPNRQELRTFLFQHLEQVYNVLDKSGLYAGFAVDTAEAGRFVAKGETTCLSKSYELWNNHLAQAGALPAGYHETSWLIIVQSGILNENVKKILREMHLKGTLPAQECEVLEDPALWFFAHEASPHRAEILALWAAMIQSEFPIHVFTLDAQVEEQNVYEAFARRREMQLALAYSVARGSFNMGQKLAFSRQLALDQANIGLNRTVVGFSHGNDTFGWYFHPRVQAPPPESTNIGALARTIWSTGPTEKYDLRHRELEPGIRECEVLIAMPSFVNRVNFDVTTNWECLSQPGITKRSYEEMIAQGREIHKMKACLGELPGAECYRPGDVARLISRIDQLEHMLALQTHQVTVPYAYEQSGADLFDKGDVYLRPECFDFYGLDLIQTEAPGSSASFFITGRNFHPTQTHVIVGGSEFHALLPLPPQVEVINRQLIHVRVTGLNPKLSSKEGAQVRVGTPAGLSNPLRIRMAADPPPPPKGWSFAVTEAKGTLCGPCGKAPERKFTFAGGILPGQQIVLTHDLEEPLPPANARLVIQLSGTKGDGTPLTFLGKKSANGILVADAIHMGANKWQVDSNTLSALISETLTRSPPDVQKEAFKLTVTAFLGFDSFPTTKVLKPIEVTILQCDCICPPPAGARDVGLPLEDEPMVEDSTPQEEVPAPPPEEQSLPPAGVRFRMTDG